MQPVFSRTHTFDRTTGWKITGKWAENAVIGRIKIPYNSFGNIGAATAFGATVAAGFFGKKAYDKFKAIDPNTKIDRNSPAN